MAPPLRAGSAGAEQFARWLGGVARGDLGWSFTQQRPVGAVLAEALPRTVALVGTALTLAFAGGVLLGAAAAWRPRARGPRWLLRAAVALHATPEFALGLALVSVVAVRLALLPAAGLSDPMLDMLGSPHRPAGRPTAPPGAARARARAGVDGDRRAPPARRARRGGGRGLRAHRARQGRLERRVLLRHALRPALAPTLTLLGLALPTLVSGAVITETVFAWPGMGLVVTQAVGARDYALVTGAVIVGSAAVAVGSLVVDLLVSTIDPRVGRLR
jgi:peptide/nickel transport system permease protein